MKTCPKCGGKCDDHYIFCDSCGYEFKDTASAENTKGATASTNIFATDKSQPSADKKQPYQKPYQQSNQQPNQNPYAQSSQQPYSYVPQQNSTPPYPFKAPQNNPLAIASLVLGILSVPFLCIKFIGVVTAILAIVFGTISRGSIKNSNGRETGMGMSTAGLILGIVSVAIVIIAIIIMVIFGISAIDFYNTHDGNSFTSNFSA